MADSTTIRNILSRFHHFGYSAYCEESQALKIQYHSIVKRQLRKLAKALNLPKGTYSIRSNMAGMAVAGEVTLHAEHLYICVSADFAYFRNCQGLKDYTGGQNHNFFPVKLDNIDAMQLDIRQSL